MKYMDRRRYKAWLRTALEKESLNHDEIMKIIRGQLALPARKIDGGLLKECFAALEIPGGEKDFANEERTWSWIRGDIAALEGGIQPAPALRRRRMAVLILTAVLLLALAAAAIATAFGYRIFGFPFPADYPVSYVQDGAYALTQLKLAHASYAHVDVQVREAVYDGKELRVVYSVRDRNATRMFTEADKYQPIEAAALDGVRYICDWVEIDGQHVMLSDTGEEPGDLPGEMVYSFRSLLSDQDVHPEGVFTVGLPLLKDEKGMTFAPQELSFTLNAEDAKKWVRKAEPAELLVDHFRITMAEAEFSPLSGTILLVVRDETYVTPKEMEGWTLQDGNWTGEESRPLEEEAERWGEAELYTPDGKQVGIAEVEYWSYREGPGLIPTRLRITPPHGEGWPEEMLLIVCDEKGNKDPDRSIPVRLKQ